MTGQSNITGQSNLAGRSMLSERLDGLSPQEQARLLARIGRTLRDALAAHGEEVADADAALALVERWAQGEPISGRDVSEQVYSERETGVLRRLTDAADGTSHALWNALVTAVMYVAWLAYRRSGERMPEDVSEVDETTPDLIESQWRATAAFDPQLLAA